MRIGRIVTAFGAAAFTATIVPLMIFFALGHRWADADSPPIAVTWAFVMAAALALAGAAGMSLVLLPFRRIVEQRRWQVPAAMLFGAAAAVAAGVGVLPALARLLQPFSGRVAWLLACTIAGIAAGVLTLLPSAAYGSTLRRSYD